MAVESIAKTLGAGSGIDIGALVNSLVEAQFAGKKEALTRREETLEAQISGTSKLREAITSFDKALKQLVRGGTLSSTLASSNELAIKASFATGATPRDVTAAIGVRQLASAQVSTTNTAFAAGTQFRTGRLTLTMGRDVVDANGNATGFTAAGGPITIDIGSNDRTLDGIAARINAAGASAGVTASVITDGTGQRLSIKGAMGADQAFEISTTNTGGLGGGGGESLAALTVNRTATQTTSGTRARDAIVTVDGVQYNRNTNTISDIVPDVKLELMGTSASPVRLTTTKPTAALTEAVNNFVDTYNEVFAMVREEDDPVDGALRSDSAVNVLQRSMKRLTTVSLAPAGAAGAPRTLADLGVRTARDGTLSVDQTRLAKAIADFPQAVERMLAEGTGTTEAGLPQALGAIASEATSKLYGLDASAATYRKKKLELLDAQLKVADAEAVFRARLTKQFAGMDARTSAYKATMSFMDNQIKAWNRSDA